MSSNGLVQVEDGIWTVDHQIRLTLGVIFPVKSHIFRLKSGALLIHSPVKFSQDVAAEIEKLGEVETIFAPNLFHNTYIMTAKRQFPAASLVAPLGMESKKKEIIFDEFVGPGESLHLSEDFDHVFVQGAPKFNEVVLRHRASNSLVVADYFFNIHEVKGLFTKLLLDKFSDAYQKPTQSKLWHKMVTDKEDAAQSARDVLAMDFERIYCSHGRVIENGREVAEQGLKWLF